jgi:ketosteroid isomerase-like protein
VKATWSATTTTERVKPAAAIATSTPNRVKLAAVAEQDSPELAAFKKAIRAKYDMKEKAFAAGDAATIVEKFYAEDARSVGEGYGVFKGREQLRPLYEQAVKELNVKVTSRHTVVKGDAGWDWADFYVTPKNPAEKPFNLAILFLWMREHGDWICKGDFYVHGDFAAGTVEKPAAPAAQP